MRWSFFSFGLPFLLVAAACGDAVGTTTTTFAEFVESQVSTTTQAPTTTVTTTVGPATTLVPPTSTMPAGVIVPDPSGDCRQAFTDDPAPCGEGVDITGYEVAVMGGDVEVDMHLDREPMPTESDAWFAEIVVEFDGTGFGCGLSNLEGGFEPTSMLHPYVYDYQATQGLDETVCDGMVEMTDAGSVVVLRLDVMRATGMEPAPDMRIAGGTTRRDVDGTMGSADDMFNDLLYVDGFGFVSLVDLCNEGGVAEVCTE